MAEKQTRKAPNEKVMSDLKEKYTTKTTNTTNTKKTKIVIPEESKKLSHKQIMFCEEYIKTQDAAQSYMKAYPNCKKTSAYVISCNLLKKLNIRKYIDERLKPIQENEERKAIADANEILEFITAVVRGEVKDQLGFDTSVKDRLTASKLLADRYRLFDKADSSENKETEESEHKVIIEVVNNSELEKELYEANK